jgi:hypothetical protein
VFYIRVNLLHDVWYYEQIECPVAAVEEYEKGGKHVGGATIQVHLESMQRRLVSK